MKEKEINLELFAVQDEIEDILDVLTDEAIVFDESNYMAYSDFNGHIGELLSRKKLVMYIIISIITLVLMIRLHPWNYFRKWLIDGFLPLK